MPSMNDSILSGGVSYVTPSVVLKRRYYRRPRLSTCFVSSIEFGNVIMES